MKTLFVTVLGLVVTTASTVSLAVRHAESTAGIWTCLLLGGVAVVATVGWVVWAVAARQPGKAVSAGLLAVWGAVYGGLTWQENSRVERLSAAEVLASLDRANEAESRRPATVESARSNADEWARHVDDMVDAAVRLKAARRGMVVGGVVLGVGGVALLLTVAGVIRRSW